MNRVYKPFIEIKKNLTPMLERVKTIVTLYNQRGFDVDDYEEYNKILEETKTNVKLINMWYNQSVTYNFPFYLKNLLIAITTNCNNVFLRINEFKYLIQQHRRKYSEYDTLYKEMKHKGFNTGFSMANNMTKQSSVNLGSNKYRSNQHKLYMQGSRAYQTYTAKLNTNEKKKAFWQKVKQNAGLNETLKTPVTPPGTPPGTPFGSPPGTPLPNFNNELAEAQEKERLAKEALDAQMQLLQEPLNKLAKLQNTLTEFTGLSIGNNDEAELAELLRPVNPITGASHSVAILAELYKQKGGKYRIKKTRTHKMRKMRNTRNTHKMRRTRTMRGGELRQTAGPKPLNRPSTPNNVKQPCIEAYKSLMPQSNLTDLMKRGLAENFIKDNIHKGKCLNKSVTLDQDNNLLIYGKPVRTPYTMNSFDPMNNNNSNSGGKLTPFGENALLKFNGYDFPGLSLNA